jgi:hypothetical protein
VIRQLHISSNKVIIAAHMRQLAAMASFKYGVASARLGSLVTDASTN